MDANPPFILLNRLYYPFSFFPFAVLKGAKKVWLFVSHVFVIVVMFLSCLCACECVSSVLACASAVGNMHRSSKTRLLTGCVARGTTDAVIFYLRNHGDSPFSSVLCLLASLSNDRTKTYTACGGRIWEAAPVWWADIWQSRATYRLTEVHCLALHVERSKRTQQSALYDRDNGKLQLVQK